jgi:hypothetical protein
MTSYLIYKQGVSRVLFTNFERIKNQGIKCFYLNPAGKGPIKKISLFYFPVYQDTGSSLIQEKFKEKFINLSYIPESEFNSACYFAEFIVMENGKFKFVRPESYGCDNLFQLVYDFLFHSNYETGYLSLIKNVSDKKPIDSRDFNWYVDFFNNNVKVSHAGNQLTGNWKYFITDEEEAEYQEAFKKLFRSKVSSKFLNLEYANDLFNQILSNSKTQNIKIDKKEEFYF